MRALVSVAAVLLGAAAGRTDVVYTTNARPLEGDVFSINRDALVVLDRNWEERTVRLQMLQRVEFGTNKEVCVTLRMKKEPIMGVAVSLAGRTLTIRDRQGAEKKVPLMNAERVAFYGVGKPFMFIAQGGAPLDLDKVLVRGRVTVLNFFASQHPTSRTPDNVLKGWQDANPDIFVRQIDIMAFGSPVGGQFSIHHLPMTLVYSSDGGAMGEPAGNRSVADLIKEGRRKL